MQQKARFSISGMTCQACASRIEKVLNKKDFISEANVNFASEEAVVTFDGEISNNEAIAAIIRQAGFEATLQTESGPTTTTAAEHPSHLHLWLLLAINIPFIIGMAGMLLGQHHWMLPPIWQFVLASIVQLWLATPFYRGAWASVKGGLANMDVLVSLGTLAIYLYSAFILFAHPSGHGTQAHVYFEAGVMVIGFVSLGKFLEQRTKKASLNSLGELLTLTPKQVNVERNGSWQTLPLNQVRTGELIRAGLGERIAADGVVESGNGWADESHLTGESNPEAKTVGSRVLAGAMITGGSITYRAEHFGSQTLLGDMMAALAEAQGSKAPIARVADKVAAVFVPAVVGIALLTFVITGYLTSDWVNALMNAVAVLVIACPCALGLATPAAIMVGMGKAVKHGIWFKDAATMEEAARVDTVVLDKTGTLTQGRPKVAAVWLAPDSGYNENSLYRAAAAVEQYAKHPLADAVINAAKERQLDIPDAENIVIEAGAGISADVSEYGRVCVGKPEWCGISPPQDMDAVWQISSLVAVSADNGPIGIFALADELKADTAEAIRRLQEKNIDIHIMSGDRPEVVAYIAQKLNIKHAKGNMNPREKAAAIQALRHKGRTVAMVGDGINDAPALAAANIGFAMKNGADIAESAASATLMQHSVNQMVDALLISRATLKNIKQNLFFAFIYNILGIPLAAFGLLNPIIAGAAMALSSVSVLANALRLKNTKVH
ncbi:metal ABC transporter ATPase [Neisseria arctica]|uniref:Metal ABC transporter ATPase n=1 Tax=Neisseria arctica TaxID=1470200 RepID=A0A0J0YQZ3_9NEIS|nr:heavy metal translocating P-type ATPase [Neisseria arctica]KLT72561.1 metal ABC transporter ATPase [Neisseria arctica]UOO87615.1 heavy metal translocating P-type ATPase [Neisseria arctica]